MNHLRLPFTQFDNCACFSRHISYVLVACVGLIFFVPVVMAAAHHGTFFGLYIEHDFAVVAIDSLEVDTAAIGPSYRDGSCELMPLSS